LLGHRISVLREKAAAGCLGIAENMVMDLIGGRPTPAAPRGIVGSSSGGVGGGGSTSSLLMTTTTTTRDLKRGDHHSSEGLGRSLSRSRSRSSSGGGLAVPVVGPVVHASRSLSRLSIPSVGGGSSPPLTDLLLLPGTAVSPVSTVSPLDLDFQLGSPVSPLSPPREGRGRGVVVG